MADKTYCNPDSDVLVNLLDCRDERLLQKKERLLTAMRLLGLLTEAHSCLQLEASSARFAVRDAS